MELGIIVTAGAFSALLLQGIKWLWRKYVAKDPLYDFPVAFYLVSIPVLNVLVVPLLAIIGFQGFVMPTDWIGYAQQAVQIFIQSLISVFVYKDALKPMAVYRQQLADVEAQGGVAEG